MKKSKYIIISHGSFASGLKEAIEMILGPQENVKAFCLLKDMAPETFGELIKKEIDKNIEENSDTMIFVDLLGGTPFNSIVPLLQKYKDISFITGVNLGMCLEIISNGTYDSMKELETDAKGIGIKSIVTKSDLFKA